MKKQTKRILMTIVGVLVSVFSVGMFNYSAFGMDPFQVFAHGIWYHLNFGYGIFYAIVNLIMLLFVFLFDRKKIGLGTVINVFLLGYVVEWSSWLFESMFPIHTIVTRVVLLFAGIIIMCFGSSLYFTANMGVSTYDAVALIISEKGIAKFQYCRIASDLVCTIIGALLGATVGFGTLVTAFFMGPFIAFFNKNFSSKLLDGSFRFGGPMVPRSPRPPMAK